jgi:hypothetical protein
MLDDLHVDAAEVRGEVIVFKMQVDVDSELHEIFWKRISTLQSASTFYSAITNGPKSAIGPLNIREPAADANDLLLEHKVARTRSDSRVFANRSPTPATSSRMSAMPLVSFGRTSALYGDRHLFTHAVHL